MFEATLARAGRARASSSGESARHGSAGRCCPRRERFAGSEFRAGLRLTPLDEQDRTRAPTQGIDEFALACPWSPYRVHGRRSRWVPADRPSKPSWSPACDATGSPRGWPLLPAFVSLNRGVFSDAEAQLAVADRTHTRVEPAEVQNPRRLVGTCLATLQVQRGDGAAALDTFAWAADGADQCFRAIARAAEAGLLAPLLPAQAQIGARKSWDSQMPGGPFVAHVGAEGAQHRGPLVSLARVQPGPGGHQARARCLAGDDPAYAVLFAAAFSGFGVRLDALRAMTIGDTPPRSGAGVPPS